MMALQKTAKATTQEANLKAMTSAAMALLLAFSLLGVPFFGSKAYAAEVQEDATTTTAITNVASATTVTPVTAAAPEAPAAQPVVEAPAPEAPAAPTPEAPEAPAPEEDINDQDTMDTFKDFIISTPEGEEIHSASGIETLEETITLTYNDYPLEKIEILNAETPMVIMGEDGEATLAAFFTAAAGETKTAEAFLDEDSPLQGVVYYTLATEPTVEPAAEPAIQADEPVDQIAPAEGAPATAAAPKTQDTNGAAASETVEASITPTPEASLVNNAPSLQDQAAQMTEETETIVDDATPMAASSSTEDNPEEVIADDENPLGAFDLDPYCWVHYLTVLGLAVTAIYGAVVIYSRVRDINHTDDFEDYVLGKAPKPVEKEPETSTAAQGLIA